MTNTIRVDEIGLKSDSLWTLERLTQCPENCSLVVTKGFMPFIFESCQSFTSNISSPALRIIQNIVYHSENDLEVLITMGLIPILFTLLENRSNAMKKEVLFTFSNIFSSGDDKILSVLNDSRMEIIINFIDSPIIILKKEAVFIICNGFAKRNMKISLKLIHYNCLPKLVKALETKESNILKAIIKGLRFLFDLAFSS